MPFFFVWQGGAAEDRRKNAGAVVLFALALRFL
jgi:hypothetical protein